MRELIVLFIRRPVTVIMILAALIIAAVFSLFTLPVNRLPDFSLPRVTVEIIYQGMAANEVKTLVTIPVEDALSPVKGLEKMKSVSRDNRSLISMDFRWGTDPMAASVLVREAIDMVYSSLPEGVNKPLVTAGDSANEPHAVIAVSSHNGDSEFARKLAEYELRARLRRINGVGSIVLVGGEITEEKLLLDTPRLAAFGLSPSEFAGLLAQETSNIPAGNAIEGNMELVVVSSGRPDSINSLSRIILSSANGTLTVADAGVLSPAATRRESIFVYNGKEATALEIFRRPGSDPLRLSREIEKTVAETELLFLRDAHIEIVNDTSPSLIRGIINLLVSASLGAIAVITVLFIFIRRIKYSLLASFSIPVSAAASICVLSITGRSLNSMSLGGLAMGIGLVSDISVIILDLLHRNFGKRNIVPDAEETGNHVFSIAGSSIASTLTTTIVFIPIILLPGPIGSLFSDMSIALVVSVCAGWFYAQFCLASLYRLFFNAQAAENGNQRANHKTVSDGRTVHNTIFKNLSNKIKLIISDNSLEKKYSRLLNNIFHNPVKIFTLAVFSCAIGICTLLLRPVVFVNPDEAEEVWVSAVFPPGTLLETVGAAGSYISQFISELPFIKTVYGKAGAEEEDVIRRADIDYLKEEFILRCVLEKGIKPDKALSEIKTAMASFEQSGEFSSSAYFPKDRTEILLGLSAESTFVIQGKDRSELLERIQIAEDEFKSNSIAVNIRPRGKRPELRLYPNREASAYLSITALQMAETLYVLNEGIVATRLELEGRPLDVRVTGQNSGYDDPVKRLEQYLLQTPQGKTVYLGSLGRIVRMEAEASLARLDRADAVYADFLPEKKNLASAKNFTSSFSWLTWADKSVFSRYRNSIILYIILVLILLYMTMGAQFESFFLPLILMISIPFSLAGAGPVLLITGAKIDSGAVLGMIALFGLVVNNCLILFEVSDEKIQNGCSPAAAVYYGASERLRAILITTATTIFALLPLVISPLGNSQKSMAAAMLGGLAASTLLSLFAFPPILIKFFKWKLIKEKSL